MKKEALSSYKKAAIKSAKEAGRILIQNYKKITKISQKSKNNFVTNVDLAAEKAIFKVIKKFQHSILSEEAGSITRDSDYKWIIDPLDGTHNYIHGLPMFGVSIALEHKKKIILGVICMPMLNQLYVAEKGKGAFLNGKKIHVSKAKELSKSMVLFDSALHEGAIPKIKVLKKISRRVSRIRMSGAAVFDLSSVAVGNAEALIDFKTHPWDVAAGFLLIREAGGKVTDFKGKNIDHYSRSFVASNGRVHKGLLRVLK